MIIEIFAIVIIEKENRIKWVYFTSFFPSVHKTFYIKLTKDKQIPHFIQKTKIIKMSLKIMKKYMNK